jgi:hypothetical protein
MCVRVYLKAKKKKEKKNKSRRVCPRPSSSSTRASSKRGKAGCATASTSSQCHSNHAVSQNHARLFAGRVLLPSWISCRLHGRRRRSKRHFQPLLFCFCCCPTPTVFPPPSSPNVVCLLAMELPLPLLITLSSTGATSDTKCRPSGSPRTQTASAPRRTPSWPPGGAGTRPRKSFGSPRDSAG